MTHRDEHPVWAVSSQNTNSLSRRVDKFDTNQKSFFLGRGVYSLLGKSIYGTDIFFIEIVQFTCISSECGRVKFFFQYFPHDMDMDLRKAFKIPGESFSSLKFVGGF